MAKPVIGLTGGIASGKSSVARFFQNLGVLVVDADSLARRVVEPGTPGLARVVERFGHEVLGPDGSLDRKKLGAIVFGDEGARADLNSITHPLIAVAGAEALADLEGSDAPYALYEAALLVEGGSYRAFPGLIVVSVEPETQLTRLMERDGFTEEEAKARIQSQLPLEKKVEVADFVIHNQGSVESLEAAVRDVHRQILERYVSGGDA